MAELVVTLAFKGKTEPVRVQPDDTTDVLFAAAVRLAAAEATKLIFKGKQLSPGQPIRETALHGAKAPKLMVMATGAAAVADVQAAKSDPTIRGFAAEDEAAQRLKEDSAELSEWVSMVESANGISITHSGLESGACSTTYSDDQGSHTFGGITASSLHSYCMPPTTLWMAGHRILRVILG